MVITISLAHQVSDDELLALSQRNPGYQFERTARGELIVTPTGIQGGHREALLAHQLSVWADRDRRGLVFSSSTGFRLPDGALLAPDAAWVHRERFEALDAEQRKQFGPLCPDAAFEIRSESNTMADLREKARAYIVNGARLVVLLDPYERIVEVSRPGRDPEISRTPKTVALDPELPGFLLDLTPIFAA